MDDKERDRLLDELAVSGGEDWTFCKSDVVEYLRVRACDPWDDELWPAAHAVLNIIADEFSEWRESDTTADTK